MSDDTTPPDLHAGAWGVGIATLTASDRRVLDTWYPSPALDAGGAADVPDGGSGSGTGRLDAATATKVLGVAVGPLVGPRSGP